MWKYLLCFYLLAAPAWGQGKTEHDPCKNSKECDQESGLACQLGTCQFTKKGCRKSLGCKKSGQCKFALLTSDSGAHCAVTKKGCARSLNCKEKGACGLGGAIWNPSCAPTRAKHCKKSVVCKTKGLCSMRRDEDAESNVCFAKKNADCAKAKVCTEGGRCTAKKGQCVK